jgi:succinyl-CoA synthetase beta subunit
VAEVGELAGKILGMQLVTAQTGAGGQKVRRLLVEEGADIQKEIYLAVLTDRATQKVAIMGSSEGGMDIEKVAHDTPEKILKIFVDPSVGVRENEARQLAAGIGVPEASQAQAVELLKKLYRCYMETDASLAEINPLIIEGDGNVKALDAKFNFDANALFRHPEIAAFATSTKKTRPRSRPASSTSPTSSSTATSAASSTAPGLAMATMDTIKLFGGSPANFLDVGGGATAEKVTEAFKIMLSTQGEGDPRQHLRRHHALRHHRRRRDRRLQGREPHVPLVVRMKGTNEELGKKMLPSRPADHQRRDHGRGGAEGHGAAEVSRHDHEHPDRQDTRVITQGITGKTGPVPHPNVPRLRQRQGLLRGRRATRRRPARDFEAFPIFASVAKRRRTGATVSVIYVPPAGARAAIWEAVEAELDLASASPKGIPVSDMLECATRMQRREATAARRRCCWAQLPRADHARRDQDRHHAGPHPPARAASASSAARARSPTKPWPSSPSRARPVERRRHRRRPDQRAEAHRRHAAVQRRPGHRCGVMIGEIGGPDEADAARWCKEHMKKPIVGFIAGVTAPPASAWGHAGSTDLGRSRHRRRQARRDGGERLHVTRNPSEMGRLMKGLL